MSDNLNNRENDILRLAHGFLSFGRELPMDAQIDAEFLFRFEVGWCRWISGIREMICSLFGKNEFEKLTPDDIARLFVHLEVNAGVVASINIEPNITRPVISTARGNYHILDGELKSKQEQIAREAVKTSNTIELEKILWEIWGEANQTQKILDALWRLARAYRLVPIIDKEAAQFPLIKIQDQFRAVVNWVMWEQVVPSFLYKEMLMIENRSGVGIVRIIRPHPWEGKQLPKTDQFGIRPETRVRTWAVYFHTKRGGGRMIEKGAIELWNREFTDTLTERNFRSERQRLFSHISKSG
jgi:hypothetical protein